MAATRELILAANNAKDTLKKNSNNMKKDIDNFNQQRNLERASMSLSEESESNLSISNKNEVENARTRFPIENIQPANLNDGHTVVALYGHLSNQENQLNFAEGDKICLIGDNLNGMHFLCD